MHAEKTVHSLTPVPTSANSIFSQFISTFKRFCNKEFKENIWQSRSNDHIIRDRRDYDEHIKYIYENPMRWQYGYVIFRRVNKEKHNPQRLDVFGDYVLIFGYVFSIKISR